MKPGGWMVLIGLAALALAGCGGQQSPTPTPGSGAGSTAPPLPADGSRTEQARAFVDLLAQGDYSAAAQQFDAQMAAALPAAKLQEIWDALTSAAQAGPFKQQLEAQSSQVQGSEVVVVTCEFAKARINVQISYSAQGQINGLYFKPAAAAPPVAYDPPAYVRAGSFSEREVALGEGEWVLTGTLSLPNGRGPFPAVVLVHGSGPNDRDETIGPNKPFRDLAGGLASQGIAVLRYDKRTLVHGAKMQQLADLTLNEETVDDAVAAAELLRTTAAIDPQRIFVLGHSLGGYALPRVGAADPQIRGLIVLAGSSRPLEDLLVEQYTYIFSLDGAISAEEEQQLDQVKAQAAQVKAPDLAASTPADLLPFGIPAPYWLDLRDYDPAADAAQLKQPMLFLQGERDYQVTLADLERWQAALAKRPAVTFKTYPALNHLFMTGPGAKATPAEYEQTGHIDPQVIADIGAWILAH